MEIEIGHDRVVSRPPRLGGRHHREGRLDHGYLLTSLARSAASDAASGSIIRRISNSSRRKLMRLHRSVAPAEHVERSRRFQWHAGRTRDAGARPRLEQALGGERLDRLADHRATRAELAAVGSGLVGERVAGAKIAAHNASRRGPRPPGQRGWAFRRAPNSAVGLERKHRAASVEGRCRNRTPEASYQTNRPLLIGSRYLPAGTTRLGAFLASVSH